ncbi:hypothetical protein EUX98_g6126 [Antrodiella citrinella]|uniref:mannan endo-1,4-beta-mannosidase n=1 Tax=Antrodiella citrinella TaxID=2447956 RepID=A0A4S4MRP9_9APHY|nr:hypothetical protein EUX98_g6126 [Antrodiella citrinella]
MKQAGVKVLRTWGFNAINGSELAGALQSGLTYYQGLQRLDNVIKTAEKYDIKVLLAFTNNWVGYGGMELYINWIAGSNNTHDVFYTDPRIVASYRKFSASLLSYSWKLIPNSCSEKYVRTIVERYKDSPAIFAWELMNEARCLGDLPAGPACVAGTNLLPQWYKAQSDFVRSLDPYHMITTGGEGHFFWADPETYWLDGTLVSDYNFNGDAGENFDLDITFPNIDFAPVPSNMASILNLIPQVPTSQYKTGVLDGSMIISTVSANRAGKPLLLEEFGVDGLSEVLLNIPPAKAWVEHALDTKHAGIMPWQFGQLGLSENGGNRLIKYADALINGASPNDGFAIYPNETAVRDIFT